MVIDLGAGTDDLFAAIDATGVEYTKSVPRPGVIMASAGDLITIAQTATPWGAIAAVLVAWIRARASRRIIITQRPDYKVIHAEGLSIDEVEQLLASTARITVFDTDKTPPLKFHTEEPE